jgi:hypothetical protein
LDTSACLRDRFSDKFLKQYPTVEMLLSTHAQASLLALAATMHVDIARIECRHASIRRLMRGSAQTHGADFSKVSADFVMLRQRLLERCGTFSKKSAKQKKPKRKRKGGGGAQRLPVSRFLTGKKYASSAARKRVFKKANEEYSKVVGSGGEPLAELIRSGSSGTLSHRFGEVSFRSKRRRVVVPQALEVGDAPVDALVPWQPSLEVQLSGVTQGPSCSNLHADCRGGSMPGAASSLVPPTRSRRSVSSGAFAIIVNGGQHCSIWLRRGISKQLKSPKPMGRAGTLNL